MRLASHIASGYFFLDCWDVSSSGQATIHRVLFQNGSQKIDYKNWLQIYGYNNQETINVCTENSKKTI